MPKAKDVAAELRKLADALDREPETGIQTPSIMFNCSEKETFLAVARLFPRPFTKGPGKYLQSKMELAYEAAAIVVQAWIECSLVCRLVRPATEAVYDCDPLLSQAEEDSLEAV